MLKEYFRNQPKIYSYWLVFTFLTGIGLVFIIPPFQSPDEFNHFYRAYQISDGQFVGEFDNTRMQLGGYIPESLIYNSTVFDSLMVRKSNKTTFDTIKKYLNTPLEKNKKIFEPFPNTARYFLTAYLPQAITISFLKQFDTPPLWMMYIGRLMTFLIWFLLVNVSVRKIPVCKELLMCFLLLPTSLAINSTLNADVVTNALFFLIFMFFFQFKYRKARILPFELFIFSLILLLTTINKICYFPILFLLIFVKSEKFGSLKLKINYLLFNLILNITVALFFSNKVHELVYPNEADINVTTYANMRPGYNINPDLQIKKIIDEPFIFLEHLIRQSFGTISMSSNSWIGSFGWENSIPNGLITVFGCFLILFVLLNKSEFKFWERFGLITIGFAMTMLFLLSSHLHWDGIGDFIENRLGGKYYIPIFPIYFWSISGLLSNFFNQNTKLKTFLNWSIIFLFIVIYVDLWILIFQRYYI